MSISTAQLTAQMLDRGVLPDLIPPAPTDLFSIQKSQFATFLQQGAKQLPPAPATPEFTEFITWSVDRQPVRWLSRIDALVQSIVPVEDTLRQRWLRLAPRYLGRLAQSDHGIALTEPEIAQLKSQCNTLIEFANMPGQGPLQITIQTR